ncbi:DNA repair protein REV1-like isoform X2 [Artemia franciscana]|nr:hypothetical protein QYM36_000860 [Artemia franciscana]
MAAKKAKLEKQFEIEADAVQAKEGIFSGISIFVNGFTDPSAEELKQIMAANSGTYHHYHKPGKTSYIIASNLPDTKIKQLKTSEVYVKPQWITESLRAGKLLSYKDFLLVPTTHGQKKLNFTAVNSVRNANLDSECENFQIDLSLPKITQGRNDSEESWTWTSQASFNDSGVDSEKQREGKGQSVTDRTIDDFKEVLSTAKVDTEVVEDLRPSSTESNAEDVALVSEAAFSRSHSPVGHQRHLRAGEEHFLSEFYNRSRLHHISTLSSMFKDYVSELRKKSNGEFPGLNELLNNENAETSSVDLSSEKVLMHIDMDCFFVSVGLRNYPELVGLPVAVTHAKSDSKSKKNEDRNRELEFRYYKERVTEKMKDGSVTRYKFSNEEDDTKFFGRISEIDETDSMAELASCSYEARAKGIKNGMFLGQALKLCPELRTIPYDFEGYKDVAFRLYDTVAEYTHQIEAVSCDEMYVDVTDVLRETGCEPLEFTSHLRQKIYERTRCTASTGLGPNLLLARMATKKAKPNGQYHILAKEAKNFMASQLVESLPGVGRATTYRLQSRGIRTCDDLQKISLSVLQNDFGVKTGETLYRHCRGEDPRKLETEHVRKSISVAVNYGIRFVDENESKKFLHDLSEEVSKRMVEAKVTGRKITLQVLSRAKGAPIEAAKFMGHGVCDAYSKSATLSHPISETSLIESEVVKLLKQLNIPAVELRGLGIHISKLETGQPSTGLPSKSSILPFLSKTTKEMKTVASTSSVTMDSLSENQGGSSVCSHPRSEELYPESDYIDPAFLEALPSEIREEILSSRAREAKLSAKDWRVTSFSQVDKSVLKELPEELQKEIRNELIRPDPEVRPGPSKSPRKPGKKISPSKRGRKKNLGTSTAGQTSVKALFNKNTEIKQQNIAEKVSESENTLRTDEPNLAGAYKLEDVKRFLEEWLQCSDQPESEDISIVTQYFIDLIHNKKLHVLDLLVKYLLRLLKTGKFDQWREPVKSIVDHVQFIMLQVHGGQLKVEEF